MPSADQTDHDDFGGLLADLARVRLLDRRRALGLLGTAGGTLALAACGGDTGTSGSTADGTTATPTPTATSTAAPTPTPTASSTGCTAFAAETNGPYPADGTNTSRGATSNVLPMTIFQRSDIRSRRLPRLIAEWRPEAIVHAAAQASVARSLADPDFDASINIVGTLALVRAGGGVRTFLYMPLMHAEDADLQHKCVAAFERLLAVAAPPLRDFIASALDYAKRHAEIVERFGRFPHRNAILGRTSTWEEIEFLRESGSSF